jgi:AcrR family transcriptional regulator
VIVEDISEKKQVIFESTLELIKEHGFHKAPMSLIAKNAGVAAGTIYHYFDSKEQLICELYNYCREQLKGVISDALAERGALKEKFVKMWISLYQFYVQQPNVLIFFEQFVNSPYNADRHPSHFRGELYTFFADGIKAGKLKPIKPEILLVMVMGTISSTAKLHLFGKIPVTRGDLDRVVEIIWIGIKK